MAKNCLSVIDRKPFYIFEFYASVIKARGLKPIVVNLNGWRYDSKSNEKLIANLENNYLIPNKNSTLKYDFSVLEKLNKSGK